MVIPNVFRDWFFEISAGEISTNDSNMAMMPLNVVPKKSKNPDDSHYEVYPYIYIYNEW